LLPDLYQPHITTGRIWKCVKQRFNVGWEGWKAGRRAVIYSSLITQNEGKLGEFIAICTSLYRMSPSSKVTYPFRELHDHVTIQVVEG
jgi:hypothetical protein